MKRGKTKKLQVCFDAATMAVIEECQEASGAVSMAEVLRAALGLYDWAREQRLAGYSVGSFKEGSPLREVVLFRR